MVGGDGLFSRYGRTESIPLLFVGVKSRRATGSKAYLAAAYFDELPLALRAIAEGKFSVKQHKRLEILKNGKSLGEVFTDVYLQRGAESNCIRYRLRVVDTGADIEEAAIGDGVVITTSAGSTGYYSYPDRIKNYSMHVEAYSKIGDDKVGVCHINPTYTERSGSDEHPLRYTVPWGSKIELWISREADARLYGVDLGRSGLRVAMKDRISIIQGRNATKVIALQQ